jgi:uncharacterized protein (TIGR00661 family)
MAGPHPKKILVAPLDWGLGHATRCIPVIEEFLSQGCEVQIASSGDAFVLLKQEFPALKFHRLTSYRVEYARLLPFMIKIIFQLPKFLHAINREHHEVAAIIEHEKIDVVISDNRYGCWSKAIPSVLITHQLNMLMPAKWRWIEWIINFGNHSQIRKFTACWVPDFANGITGKMSEERGLKSVRIGMLSRFENHATELKYEVLVILSGPEPQRSMLEKKLRQQLTASNLNYFMALGKPSDGKDNHDRENNHGNARQLNELIESSQVIVARSGYTTIMDLWKLGKKTIFIPTPGQTEQEYLADELKRKGIAFSQSQDKFDLQQAILESRAYRGFESFPSSPNLLAIAVNELLNK